MLLSIPLCNGMQVLTALELARQARIAANRAYLAGLQRGPEAMSKGEVRPLQVADPVVLSAARQLATTAALCQAKHQVRTHTIRKLKICNTLP